MSSGLAFPSRAELPKVVRRILSAARPARLRARFFPEKHDPRILPDWNAILSGDTKLWQSALAASAHGPRVLLATSVGGYTPGAIAESLLAVALTLRGARVHLLLCDGALPACMFAESFKFPDLGQFEKDGPAGLCRGCADPVDALYQTLGLPLHRFGDSLTAEDRSRAMDLAHSLPLEEIAGYEDDGVPVGEHTQAGALRYFARGDLSGEPTAPAVLRRYLGAALLSLTVARRLLSQHAFQSACFHHGIYVPLGLVGAAAREAGVRVVNWNPAYRKKCFIFSHGDTYHKTIPAEPTVVWEDLPWNRRMESAIMAYLRSRWDGSRDWIFFFEKPEKDVGAIAQELGIDFSKPTIGLLTNVMWDARLHYLTNAFMDMRSWVMETIRYFSQRPELQLLIRVHPAEVRGTVVSRQPIVAEIEREFPELPPNVYLVGPTSDVSTYAAMKMCNAAIIYGTKMGVELTSLGIPVIVAGEAWIRNKGLTLDARSPEEYRELLDRLPFRAPMEPETVRRARMYAYHFFFRRMVPVKSMEPRKGWPHYRLSLSTIRDLMPGKDRGLDVICNGILNGTEFTYPAETLGVD